jgi:mannose-6-phosphate isomerase
MDESFGFDVIIVVASTQEQANFWDKRLKNSALLSKHTKIYSIFEKWDGGAGQLLGTLNAWKEVSKLTDLDSMIKKGCSIVIYHTAGKGKRIAPIGLSEVDKGAVRLPILVEYTYAGKGEKDAITLLEAVIHSTKAFAKTREGRVCVFWGDGLFIPEKIEYEGKHQVELFSIRGEAPDSEKNWNAQWKSYGLIIPIPAEEGSGTILREKQSWDDFNRLIKKGVIGRSRSGEITIGKSMGCFSISFEFFKTLLEEYECELREKTKKLDTDPHLWMPLTSAREDFDDKNLWDRVNRLKKNFLSRDTSGLTLFGDKDLGKTYWWDFGQLHLYQSNLLKLIEDSDEGKKMREFFRLEERFVREAKLDGLEVKKSILLDSEVKKGKVNRCVLVKTKARYLNADGSLIVNSQINTGEVKQSVVYNCIALGELKLEGAVVADLFHFKKGMVRLKTQPERDGKKDWHGKIPVNYYSYAEADSLILSEKSEKIKEERLRWENYFSLNLGGEFEWLKRRFIKPLPLANLVEKAWGGDRIERLKQNPPSGMQIGESWECSSHPTNPSKLKIKGNEVSLLHLLNYASKEILGEEIASKFRGVLPILVKFIDSRNNLSVQVHPSDEWAKKLGECESGKNEAWLILEAEPHSKIYLGFKQKVNVERLSSIKDKLNCIAVNPGDVYMVPAGTVHAIGAGILLLEVEQASDLTYRIWDWEREPKRPLHLEKAIRVLNFEPSKINDFKPIPKQISPHETILVDTPYFTLSSIRVKKGDRIEEKTKGVFHILTGVKGEVIISSEAESKPEIATFHQGESLLVPASLPSYWLSLPSNSNSEAIVLKSWLRTSQWM